MGLAFLALIVAIFGARLIQINAFRNLSDKDKEKVFSKKIMLLSKISLVFTFIFIVAFYYFIYNYPTQAVSLTLVFFTALMLQRIFQYILVSRKMNEDGVPSSYRKKYFLAWLVTSLGVALFIILFLYQFNNGAK